MSVLKFKGVILKEMPAKESDKRLVVFCEGIGKIMIYAKGARKIKSKFLSASSVFCCAEFSVYSGQGFYSLTGISLIESFYSVREDISRYAHACYMAEVIDKTLPEGLVFDELLRLFLRALGRLSKKESDPGLAARIFELKFLELSGALPEELPEYLGEGAKQAVRYVMGAKPEKIFGFMVSNEVYRGLFSYTRELM
ncbi:MAG: DNA repair protein RecO, partial [Firmicutes bacterium]|nr:DNA repair protein RecO [Bacillota bacterium]